MTDDLVKRLRYCAPERRDCGRNELAMLDAADRIEKLEAALVKIGVWNNFEDRYQGTINELIHNALEGEDD